MHSSTMTTTKLPHGTSKNMRTSRNSNSRCCAPPLFLALAAMASSLILFVVLRAKSSDQDAQQQVLLEPLTEYAISGSEATMHISVASGSILNVPYSHCRSMNMDTSRRDLVLLHGAKFTKADWETVMHKFCQHDGATVTAFDLSVRAKYDLLLKILQAGTTTQLDDKGTATTLIATLPIAALVTPSASGSIVLDGIVTGGQAVNQLRESIRRWIPVAANGALQYSSDQLAGIGDWPVTAVYGDQDAAGKLSSELLQQAAAAASLSTVTVVELPGTHPVYLDAPDAFVETVMYSLAQDTRDRG